MRRIISIRKCFCFLLICAVVVILALSLREHTLWKTKPQLRSSILFEYNHQLSINISQYNKEGIGHNLSMYHSNVFTQLSSSEERILTRLDIFHSSRRYFGRLTTSSDELKPLQTFNTKCKPWFFKNGVYYPTASPYRKKINKSRPSVIKLFPHEDPHSDRIVNQLMYVPHNYKQIRESGKLKVILLYNGLGSWNIKQGRDIFLRLKCPVDTCEVTANRKYASLADMILYKDHYVPTGIGKAINSKQIAMLYHLESPYHTQTVKVIDAINWTSTYRRDSDVMAPYEKWQYYDPHIRQLEQDHNYALNKSKKVAWFVSNCGARNGRLQYAHELQKHIQVDIYGACGDLRCPRTTVDKCFELLDRDYKFYLAFENSNCKDYITEKLFVNALSRNILPIVMGARPEDYEVSSPYRSYIHVDEFNSPKELADYLNLLDKNDELYNSYFKWKGTGEFINTYYWCRVCAVLHEEESLENPRWYSDINEWWRGTGVCTSNSWRNVKARQDKMSEY